MKIVGICGSPRDGNTEFIMKKIFESIPKESSAELILIRDMHIELCNGCLICEDREQCPIEDDMANLYNKLPEFDQILIGTPVYFDSIPGLLKNFIDRLNPLCVSEGLKNKGLYLVVVGQFKDEKGEKSRSMVIQYFKDLCEIFSMSFGKVLEVSAREPRGVSKVGNIDNLCKTMLRNILAIKKGGVK